MDGWLPGGVPCAIVLWVVYSYIASWGEQQTKAKTKAGGAIGAFNHSHLARWLRAQCGAEDSHYRAAVDNFLRSCAGYCVGASCAGYCVGASSSDS